jgi:hypothetical protein
MYTYYKKIHVKKICNNIVHLYMPKDMSITSNTEHVDTHQR